MEREAALTTFKASIGDLLGIDEDELGMDRTWEDLQVDSLGQIEVALVLCEAFDICLPEVEGEDVRTVGQVFELTLATVNDEASASGSEPRTR